MQSIGRRKLVQSSAGVMHYDQKSHLTHQKSALANSDHSAGNQDRNSPQAWSVLATHPEKSAYLDLQEHLSAC
jgi:hypothetical protein